MTAKAPGMLTIVLASKEDAVFIVQLLSSSVMHYRCSYHCIIVSMGYISNHSDSTLANIFSVLAVCTEVSTCSLYAWGYIVCIVIRCPFLCTIT